MNLGYLKTILNDLPADKLDGKLVVLGAGSSGSVISLKPAETNLYYLYDDDPAELLTEKQMQQRAEEDGEDEITEDVYIKKGEMVLHF